ncbi:unnamed protein product [Calypogeia fissa]
MGDPSGSYGRLPSLFNPTQWVVNIKKDLEPFIKTQELPKAKRPILRVGARLRKTRSEHFEPQYLFLGLYNRSSFENNNPKSKGNIFRLAVVGAFLAEAEKSLSEWESICGRIVEDPKTMLEHYNEEGLDNFSMEGVRSVLSLDAIFLACFLTNFLDVGVHSRIQARFPSLAYIVDGGGITFNQELMCDIVMLENQIPLELIHKALFLLYEVFSIKCGNQNQPGLTSAENDEDNTMDDVQTQADELLQIICTKVATFFRAGLPGSQAVEDPLKYNLVFKDKCKHLLHCVYVRLVSDGSDQTGARLWKAPHPYRKCWHKTLKFCFSRQDEPSEEEVTSPSFRPRSEDVPLASATQLRKAGIDFKGQAGLDVRFEKRFVGATVYLPRIVFFGDDSEPIWRNLLAFEDEYELGYQFVSYLDFMDELIDLEEDVALLRSGKYPVFINIGLGSNADVAHLFNTMTTDYFIDRSAKWQDVRKQILEYYNNKSRQTWVEFRRTKFGKPWLFASFLAATALLVLTFLQVVFAILTFKYSF